MAFYSRASSQSFWRGVDYYERGNVKSFSSIDEDTIGGEVANYKGRTYHTIINLAHSTRSSCTCKFAKGRRVICKHMVALYFANAPDEYEEIMKRVEAREKERELEERQWPEKTRRRIEAEVAALSAEEARTMLADLLYQKALDEHYETLYPRRW